MLQSNTMDHVLVKWVAENKWDVYPIKNVADAAVGMSLLEEPAAAVERLQGSAVDIVWEEGKPAAPALVLAVGKLSTLEKKRAKMAAFAASDDSAFGSEAVEPRCNCGIKISSLEDKIKELQEEKETYLGASTSAGLPW
ncbi:uncharacterized protein LOC142568172 [Dermacentor variabilis]|uniref:uncharacterized protein LOC142568172 n=1 Tax=Dermacentor variabilis TaxID=34621 RepID=UPI003F5B357E